MDKMQGNAIHLPQTIEECHQVILELMKIVSRVDQLTRRVQELEKENQALKEQLSLNSSNSSLPPSTDFQKKEAEKKATLQWSPKYWAAWSSWSLPAASGYGASG